MLLGRPFVLLRFHAPEYEMSDERGIVRWRIRDGMLVAPAGARATATWRSTSAAARRSEPGYARLHVEVEIANFYPALATWVARWFYANTQSRIHVLVTHGFLRSLARLELEQSAVGRFAPDHDDRRRRTPAAPVNVGDTPWPLVGALAASPASTASGAASCAATARRRR